MAQPPFPPSSAAQGASTADLRFELFQPSGTDPHVAGPYGVGQRVPMLVVSPWSTGGYVCSQTFDHTSIVQFIEARFGVAEPNVSPWRRAVCGDLTSAFDFGRRDEGVPALPDTASYLPHDHNRHPDYVPRPPSKPSLPRQEPGLRLAWPLPYDLAADSRIDAGPALRIDFASYGQVGANYLVASTTSPNGPWTYTVERAGTLTGTWPVANSYDFTVHGPNGFFRRSTGAAQAGPEVHARHDGAHNQLRLMLTNGGAGPVRVTITDGYGNLAAATYLVVPGAAVEHVAALDRSNGWYDLSIISDRDPGYLRRLGGHIETGAPSTSDPALATG